MSIKLISESGGSLTLEAPSDLTMDIGMVLDRNRFFESGGNSDSGYWTIFGDKSFIAFGRGTLRLKDNQYSHILDIGDNKRYPVAPIDVGTISITAIPLFLGSGASGTNFRENMSVVAVLNTSDWNVNFVSSNQDFSGEVGNEIAWTMMGRLK
jgi:hypothetical protein